MEVKTKRGKTYTGDTCLVCIGRAPHTEHLHLEAMEVNVGKEGFINVNEHLQTDDPRIYAVGDVTGGNLMAHQAYREAVIAVDSLLGEDPKTTFYLPQVAFTDPQIAKVGTFQKSFRVGVVSFKAISAAKLMNKTGGMIKIAVDEHGRIRGGQIVGTDAKELIHERALAVENNLTIHGVRNTPFVHPTLSEGIAVAAENALDLPPSCL